MDDDKMKIVLFRGGPMDGRRWMTQALTPFIVVPVSRSEGGFGKFRYRQAEDIGKQITVYEVDNYRQ